MSARPKPRIFCRSQQLSAEAVWVYV